MSDKLRYIEFFMALLFSSYAILSVKDTHYKSEYGLAAIATSVATKFGVALSGRRRSALVA
ncbi:hypothetical protein HDZ31DRAFT_70353 [Schizophyllum fasciatum]